MMTHHLRREAARKNIFSFSQNQNQLIVLTKTRLPRSDFGKKKKVPHDAYLQMISASRESV